MNLVLNHTKVLMFWRFTTTKRCVCLCTSILCHLMMILIIII